MNKKSLNLRGSGKDPCTDGRNWAAGNKYYKANAEKALGKAKTGRRGKKYKLVEVSKGCFKEVEVTEEELRQEEEALRKKLEEAEDG